MTAPNFLFVLEQSLGHAVHGANLEHALAAQDNVASRVVRVGPADPPPRPRVPRPFLRNWSYEASSRTRAELREAFAHARPDALYIHTQVAALLAGRFIRAVPTVVSLDATPMNFDTLGDDYGHRRQTALAEQAKWLVNRRVFHSARALVTWSQWAADSLVADYGIVAGKVRVIRPGVNLDRFRPADPGDRGGPVRILFVGGDFTRKGGEDLLCAMSRIHGAAELDIATSAPVPNLPPGVAVRVHTGLRPNSDQLLDLYRRADVFAFPSRGECYGLVVAEALASGLPVIACGVGAVPEMVVDGDNGLLVPPAAPAALTGALQTLIDQPELRQAMGRAGLGRAWMEHDAAANAQCILELMRRISRTPRRAWVVTP